VPTCAARGSGSGLENLLPGVTASRSACEMAKVIFPDPTPATLAGAADRIWKGAWQSRRLEDQAFAEAGQIT